MTLERISEKRKIDPSETKQQFNDVNIKLFCCRYWMLEEWDCIDLSVPFWRLYHNTLPGAEIMFQSRTIQLRHDQVVLIPPHTPFSTHLRFEHAPTSSERITGRQINDINDLKNHRSQEITDHLFIHFNLGFPLDFVKADIYTFACDYNAFQLLDGIKEACLEKTSVFSFNDCLKIKQLISQFLSKLPEDIWTYGIIDRRIFESMQHIEKHLSERISNETLSDQANMAVNSFARLFKVNAGVSVQQYILKARVEKACNLMYHTNKTIDEIAYECGFSDRHHFSKVFKQIMMITPAYYKKHLIIG